MTNKRDDVADHSPVRAHGFSDPELNGRTARLALALILAIVFLAYLNTLWFEFVHDDHFQIVGNIWLRSWKYLPRYFTADVWSFEHPVFRGAFYRPIFLLWFRLQYLLFGLHPWGWHLSTVLCHVGVTVLVYFSAARLLEDRLAALFATLIFGLHPTHAEAVAWVSGVTEPLSALFLFASYLCYLEKRRQPARERAYLAASLGLYALACLSKETAVILPLIIFACEFIWSNHSVTASGREWGRRSLSAFRRTAPYLALFVIYMAARIVVLQGFLNPGQGKSFHSTFLAWPAALWFYIEHLLWPVHLSPDYAFYTQFDVRTVLLPAIPVLIAGVVLYLWGKRSRQAAVAAVWIIAPILPLLVLQAFVDEHPAHDRYLYVPSFGFALLGALALRQFQFGRRRIFGQPAVQLALACVIAVALTLGILRATACYTNEIAFSTRVAASTNGHASKQDLAPLVGQQGHLDEVIKLYNGMLPTQPNSWDVNYNLGYAYYLTGKLPEADRYLTRASQLDTSRPDSFFYLGLTKLKLGEVDAAAANVQRAVTIRPDAVHYHFALGVILKLQGNLPAALSEFRQEMDLDPNSLSSRQQIEEIQAQQSTGLRH